MLAFRIAVRYLFSKKSHGAVNIISAISVMGVAVATMAIVVVLSVFNGFNDLAASSLAVLDPEIKVVAKKGKAIADADSLAAVLLRQPCVAWASATVEERALAIYNNVQMPVIIRGTAQPRSALALDSLMVEGQYVDRYYDTPATQLSAGVAQKLMARPNDGQWLQLYVPRRVGRINPANPANSFHGQEFVITGVFQVGQSEYDAQYVFIPIEEARRMLEYTTEATSVDVTLRDGYSADKAKAMFSKVLGDDYEALTRLEQQQESFRMIQIEKWVTFLMLAFILIIASFNIISTLSLLVIEKRSNMQTLRALGAPMRLVRGIFIWQGWLISVAGGFLGIILGTLLSLGQQHYGWIKLAGDPSMLAVNAYPVRVLASDVAVVFVLVVVVGFLTSQITRAFVK